MNVQDSDINKKVLRKNYYRTALPKSLGPSAPIKKFENYRKKHDIEIASVLDYGAGKQRDREFCIENYGKYVPYDNSPEFSINQPKEALNRDYDLVIFNYVLNIVIPEDRIKIIDKIREYLSKEILVLLAVRTRQEKNNIKSNWKRYEDGWVTTRLTFQHFFRTSEIIEIFKGKTKNIVDLNRGTFILIP